MVRNIKSEAFVIAFIIVIGKALAFFATGLYISEFGADNEKLNIFSYALQLQSCAFQGLGCALSGVIIPYFSVRLTEGGRKSAEKFADGMISVGFIITVVAVFVVLIFSIILTEYTDFADKAFLRKAICFLLPLMLFSCLTVIYQAIVQCLGGYIKSVMINLTGGVMIICYMLLFSDRFGISGLIFAELASGAVQAFMMIVFAAEKGYKWSLPPVSELKMLSPALKGIVPLFFGASVYQLNLFLCTVAVANRFPLHVTVYSFIQNLVFAGTVALSTVFSTIVFPSYSRLAAEKNEEALVKAVSITEKKVMAAFGIASALAFIFAKPVCVILNSSEVSLLRAFSPLIFLLGVKDMGEKYLMAVGKRGIVLLTSVVIFAVSVISYILLVDWWQSTVCIPVAYSSGVVAGCAVLFSVRKKIMVGGDKNDGFISRFIFRLWRNRKISGNVDT